MAKTRVSELYASAYCRPPVRPDELKSRCDGTQPAGVRGPVVEVSVDVIVVVEGGSRVVIVVDVAVMVDVRVVLARWTDQLSEITLLLMPAVTEP
jgi:hypothetical protein